MKPLADTLADLAADPLTPEQRARFSERFVAQLQRTHRHIGRMSKAALSRHIHQSHPQGWQAAPTDGWTRDELEAEHDRLHGGAL